MKNKKVYGFLIVGAFILVPNVVLADIGSTSSSYQQPASYYNDSLDTSLRQSVGTSRLVAKKPTDQSPLYSTTSGNLQECGSFGRSGAFQYRQGYQHRSPARKIKKFKPGLPGHQASASVPELDVSIAQSALILLFGGVFVLRARKRRGINS